MRQLDMRGKACPMPVIETKKLLEELHRAEAVTVLVDNEIAVQNLTKLAGHEGMDVTSDKHSDKEFAVLFTPTEGGAVQAQTAENSEAPEEELAVENHIARGRVVVIASDKMGEPEEELGKILVKGFIYAVSRQDVLPETILFYNGGAKLTAEGSDSVEDLKYMAEQGVEILTCGTCLKHLGLEDKLQVGAVSNMYEIAEKMTGARQLIRP
ncbi:MAG: sulfurtransferase-like selenium metabolism protein YedF [Clostridium sp.]|nr:sulfurtransferase-like selenium metabolism protein YedF [Clostridium sp.]